jgi:phospholipid/cholesterol/gamma-HCH transport system substrate-binding protein
LIVSRREKVRVGIFVVVAACLSAGIVLALAGVSARPVHVYLASFDESVSGLEEAAPVKYQGKKVGKVRRIGIDPETLLPLIEFAVAPETPVREDTTATLVVQGYATGLKYIELTKGTPASPARAPGTRVPTKPSGMVQLERSLGQAAPKAQEALGSLNRAAGALAEVAGKSDALLARNADAIDEILANMRSASRDLAEAAREVKERPALLIRDVKRGYRKVQE